MCTIDSPGLCVSNTVVRTVSPGLSRLPQSGHGRTGPVEGSGGAIKRALRRRDRSMESIKMITTTRSKKRGMMWFASAASGVPPYMV